MSIEPTLNLIRGGGGGGEVQPLLRFDNLKDFLSR